MWVQVTITVAKEMGDEGPPKTSEVTATQHDNIEFRKMGISFCLGLICTISHEFFGDSPPPYTCRVTCSSWWLHVPDADWCLRSDVTTSGQKHVMTSLMVTFIHFKFDVVRAFVIQIVLMPIGVFTSPLFKIHFMGMPAEGELARPFAEPANPLADMLKGAADGSGTTEALGEDGKEKPTAKETRRKRMKAE